MPYYKAQHEVFVRALIRHGDQLLAYRQAYPTASKESAYTAAIRLMRRPMIQARVAQAMLLHKQRERERERERQEQKRRTAEEDIRRRRIWLAKVVRGEVQCKRYFRLRSRTILIYDNLSTSITLAAIDLDTKYEYALSPKIILDRQFDRLYARANKVYGLKGLNRLIGLNGLNRLIGLNGLNGLIGQTGNRERHRPTSIVISNGAKQSVAERETISLRQLKIEMNEVISREHAMSCTGEFREISPVGRNDEVFSAEKKGQIARKKLTHSNQTPRQSTPPACNKNSICNKIKTYPASYLVASAQSARSMKSAVQTVKPNKAVISNEVECNGTQREISQEYAISYIAELQEISPCGRNDGLDLRTKTEGI